MVAHNRSKFLSLHVTTGSPIDYRMTSVTLPRKQPCEIKSADFKWVDVAVSKTHSKSKFEMG